MADEEAFEDFVIDELGPRIDEAQEIPSDWLVTFEHIGRVHVVAPLRVPSSDPDTIAQAIHNYAGRFLNSRDYEVTVDLETRTGRIFATFRTVGKFTLQEAPDA